MGDYKVEVKATAAKELAGLDRSTATRILRSLEKLPSDPRPRQSKKLSGSKNSYRLRVGDYRVLYQIDVRLKRITIFAIGHRRDVYR